MTSASVLASLRTNLDVLPAALSRIAKYILENPEKVVNQSIAELAAFSDGGQASVVRLCRQIGYDGFQNFKLALAADMARFAATQATATNDKGAIPNQLLQNTIAALHVVHDALDEKILRRIAARIRGAQRVDVYGVGISGLVAEVLAYKLLRIGIPARAFRDLTMARETADTMTKRDVAIAVSESGLTAEVAQLLGAAHLMGVHTLAITNRANSPLTEQADEVLITAYIESPLTGGALTSTTSQLHLIECLATAVADSGTPRRQKSRKA